MKKAVSALLLSAMVLGLCACDALADITGIRIGPLTGEEHNSEKPALDLFGFGRQQSAQDEKVPAYTEPEYTYPVIIAPTYEPEETRTKTLQYWVENCDRLYLSQTDLYGLTEKECVIARNAIYAKSGRIFQSTELHNYFSTYSWYDPHISPEEFSDSIFNSAQRHNLEVVLEYETRWD